MPLSYIPSRIPHCNNLVILFGQPFLVCENSQSFILFYDLQSFEEYYAGSFRKFFYLGLSEVFLIATLCFFFLERSPIEMKCLFVHAISGICNINMTHHCLCRAWSPDPGSVWQCMKILEAPTLHLQSPNLFIF